MAERKKPSKADLEEVHKRAIQRADDTYQFERENITKGRECQRFYIGGSRQWDDAAIKARGTTRPMLTVNRMPAFVKQLTGEIRRETPAIKVLPAKGKADKIVAEVFTGLIRNIEAQSDADACYCYAAENAAVANQGAFRIVTEYSSDDSFDQDIRIRPIRDPFGFMIDPLADLPDKSDMKFAWVFERISKETFKARYPKAKADDIPLNDATGAENGFTWRVGDSIRIAEYWERKTEAATIYLLENGRIVDVAPPDVAVKSTREVERPYVCSYMMSGSEILSGPHEWPGKYIPICVVPGEEITVDGATTRKSMIDDAMDPQRILNYARSTEAESIALQPKAPHVATVKQIAGYEQMWSTAGTANPAVLIYNPDPQAPGPPQRSQPPVMSQGLANLSMTASQDLKDVTNIHEASLGAKSNETSGVAIRARQQEGSTGTFLYIDNLRRAIGYAGRVLVDLIPKVYDAPRIVRVLKEDGGADMKMVNGPDPEDPMAPLLDLSLGEYDVMVSTGQGYLTRREERREALIALTQSVPAIGEVAADLLVDALDFPGGDEISKRIKTKMGIGEDGEPLPQQEPPKDPKMVADALASAAKADLTKAQAEGQELENVATLAQLQAIMAGVPQAMAGMQQMLQQILALNDQTGGQGQAAGPQPNMEGMGSALPGAAPPAGPGGPEIAIPPEAMMGGDDGTLVDMPEGAPV